MASSVSRVCGHSLVTITDEITTDCVDTFLLPSLVTAIHYLCNDLGGTRNSEHKAIIRILQLILSPSHTSPEASTTLPTVINIVAAPCCEPRRQQLRARSGKQRVDETHGVVDASARGERFDLDAEDAIRVGTAGLERHS